jgi:hypothetical protein
MRNTKTAPAPAMPEPGWSKVQQRFLAVLEHEEHRTKTVTEICQLAGYASKDSWYSALRDERFAAVIDSFGIKGRRSYGHTTDAQQRLLEVLKHEENQRKSMVEIRSLANCSESAWRWAIADERFASALKALNIPVRRNMRTPHLEVTLATNVEEELAKDVWDMRRLKHEYPKHRPPAKYEVVFFWIVNPLLREQIKCYFRQRLTKWEAITFHDVINILKPILSLLPPQVHMGTIRRSHIEALLPHVAQLGQMQANRGLKEMKIMC